MRRFLLAILFGISIISTNAIFQGTTGEVVHAASTATPPPAAINQVFPDPNLAEAVAYDLNKQPQDIVTQAELDTIIILQANNRGIQNISGVEYLNQLEEAQLYENSISDLSPLAIASMPNLVALNLRYNQISDIGPLVTADFSKLEGMSLSNNQINDISPLASAQWPNLFTLDLSHNQINDISPLANADFPVMYELILEVNQISDLSGWASADFPELGFIHFGYNPISDISPLATANLPKMRVLDFSYNQISQVQQGLPFNMPILSQIMLLGNHISDLSRLVNAGLPNLRVIDAREQTIQAAPAIYSEHAVIENVATSFDGNKVEPDAISDGGLYQAPNIIWELPEYIPAVSYTFQQYIDENDMNIQFTGEVQQPLAHAYDANFIVDGANVYTETVIENGLIPEPSAPVKDGYTFIGWFDAVSGGYQWNFAADIIPVNGITLYARWQAIDTGSSSTTNNQKVLPDTGSSYLEQLSLGATSIIIGALLYRRYKK